jgi:hypothetical protein
MKTFRLEDSIGNSFINSQADGSVWAGVRLVGNKPASKVFHSQSTMLDVAKAVSWIATVHSQDSNRQVGDYTWIEIKS